MEKERFLLCMNFVHEAGVMVSAVIADRRAAITKHPQAVSGWGITLTAGIP